jgi:hypothetical protein
VPFPSLVRYPGELPGFRLAGHEFADLGVCAPPLDMERGEPRVRRLWSVNVQRLSLSTVLTQPQFDRFYDWWEQEAQGGAERFDVSVAAQGGAQASEWYVAQAAGPYNVQMQPGHRFGVSFSVLLVEGPYGSRPTPSLAGLALSRRALLGRPLQNTLRGLAGRRGTLTGVFSSVALRGVAVSARVTRAVFAEQPQPSNNINVARLWNGLARVPLPGNEVDQSQQEWLQRAALRNRYAIH